MFEKKGKEYKESLSKAGKDSAILASLKLSGYKAFAVKKRKKKKNYNLYLDDLSPLNDNLVIMKVYETSVDEEAKKEFEIQKMKNQTIPKKKEKINFYYNIKDNKEKNEMKNDTGPPCTKYTPKYTSIYPKVIIGPTWDVISGRKYKKIEPDEKDFLITHDSIIDNEKKTLVDMNKDTRRGNYLGKNDVRIRTDKKFDYIKNFKLRKQLAKLIKNKEIDNKKENLNENKNIKTISYFKTIKEKNQEIPESNTLKKLSPYKTLQIKDKLDNNKEEKYLDNYDIYPKKHMRTIDFTKILSREKREKALSKKKLVDIIRNPDKSPLYERSRIFTYHTSQTKIPRKFSGFKSYVNYNPNKAYKIRVVHPLDKVPNFNLILPRPDENKNLPYFMQKMFNRNAEYTMNDKALQLNEYPEQKLGKTFTDFFPKKSFNNIVNMNIMTGKNFIDDYKIEDLDSKREEMKERLRYKNKNLGKLIKEGGLKRFDNFNLRTFHKTKNIMIGDLNKYLLGLKES